MDKADGSSLGMVTTPGAGRGGRLCDRDKRSCAASVSSALRVLRSELSSIFWLSSWICTLRLREELSTQAERICVYV